ncbi:MAG: HU family DNA-binding protein [Bdellovibrionales bacterium]|nr:HU family DNA-binding protein [Bdellovibrionales bacterium]
MNKTQFVQNLAKKLSWSQKQTEKALDSTLHLIQDSLSKGHEVKFVGFGAFSVKARKKKLITNPKTGEKIEIPPSKSPCFKAGKHFKQKVAIKRKISKINTTAVKLSSVKTSVTNTKTSVANTKISTVKTRQPVVQKEQSAV